MQATGTEERRGGGTKARRHEGRGVWGLLCLILLSGSALAEAGPAVKKKAEPESAREASAAKPGEEATAKPGDDATARPDEEATAKPEFKGDGPHERIDTRVQNHPFELNPDAKLVCDETTVTATPVWEGRDKLTFKFHLRNAGTADLEIKAKGG